MRHIFPPIILAALLAGCAPRIAAFPRDGYITTSHKLEACRDAARGAIDRLGWTNASEVERGFTKYEGVVRSTQSAAPGGGIKYIDRRRIDYAIWSVVAQAPGGKTARIEVITQKRRDTRINVSVEDGAPVTRAELVRAVARQLATPGPPRRAPKPAPAEAPAPHEPPAPKETLPPAIAPSGG
jgi:hypothetical protein